MMNVQARHLEPHPIHLGGWAGLQGVVATVPQLPSLSSVFWAKTSRVYTYLGTHSVLLHSAHSFIQFSGRGQLQILIRIWKSDVLPLK